MEVISSESNNLIKLARKLKQRKHREKVGKFLVEGMQLVAEVLKWTGNLERVLVTEEFWVQKTATENFFLLQQIKDKNIPISVATANLFCKLSETENSQGIIGIVKIMPGTVGCDPLEEAKNGSIIINNVQDPGNLGTIIRTADAAGFKQVLLTRGTVDPYNAKVLRAAMGSHFHVEISWINQEQEIIDWFKSHKIPVVVAHVTGGINVYAADLLFPLALVLGNEVMGPDSLWLEAADQLVKIPLIGGAESLNVAVAGAVIIYEAVRQNRFDQH